MDRFYRTSSPKNRWASKPAVCAAKGAARAAARRLQLPPRMSLQSGLEFLMAARAFAGERLTARGVTLAVGRRIINREVVGRESPEHPFVAGETVYAHTTVSGHGAGFIEHVWTRDGVETARHYMPIGDDRRWRTWSRHVLQPGEYTVEVFGPDGARLASRSFTAFAANA
jgi:Protein of unknown function (DUF2914)